MQTKSPRFMLAVATLFAATGCSSPSDGRSLRVGRELDMHDGGSSNAADSSVASGDAGGGIVIGQDNSLKVHVENPQQMTITIVTVQCAGDCADVVAVASGGNAPYTFKWEDGSINAERHVCPSETSHYKVTATDTAVTATEFSYVAQTADSDVTANVLDCSDGGGTSADACIANPSFEGPVTTNQFMAFDAPPWNACYAGGFITYSAIGDNTLWPTQNWTFPKASDGATYLALGQQGALGGRASQTLCKPLLAGESLSFLADFARAASTNASLEATSQVIQVVGGSTACNEADVLWTSAPLTSTWSTQCVTITAQHDMTSLGFMPVAAGGGGEMEGLIDHIVPVDSCP